MPYRTHVADKLAQICKVASFLEGIPQEEIPELLAAAERMLHFREFGSEGRGRNCAPNEPYWFEHSLIANAKERVAAGNPLDAYMYSLNEHNHGHSGFTDQVRRVYRHPVNPDEQAVSEKIRQMIIDVATALLESKPLSKSMDIFGDGWMTVSAIFGCLVMLGQDVPKILIDALRSLIGECKKSSVKNEEILELEHNFEKRFV